MTCTEFQNLAGRASTKNWKMSLRKLEKNGEPGPQMGDYLRDQVRSGLVHSSMCELSCREENTRLSAKVAKSKR